jgi:hypothetical protein
LTSTIQVSRIVLDIEVQISGRATSTSSGVGKMDVTCEPIDLSDGSTGELAKQRESACPLVQPGEPGEVAQSEARALEQALNRRIIQRTSGRLQFCDRLRAGPVTIQGSSPTHYLKQLTLAAVREVLPSTSVELEIRVAKAVALSGPSRPTAVLVP